MFEPVPGNPNFSQQELAIGQFWKENRIYEKSLEQRAGAKPFIFYEGPPTANGMPHPGHCLTRAIKDLFPRYRTMRGYRCERKAGWDTHGLPVEVEVCKELGIHSKEEIENFGVEPFIQKCQQSVWRYMREWERMTDRIGFWVDMNNAYATYHQSYVESVWWSLKNLFDRGLLYQGHKIVWWWAQGGTALSSGEVGEGYRQVADPSVYVKFPLLDKEGALTQESLLVWTTTPWTLPSNQFVAVNPHIDYAKLFHEHSGEILIVAAELANTISEKSKGIYRQTSSSVVAGAGLIGERYQPPFDNFYKETGSTKGTLTTGSSEYVAWRVVSADFVTTESGTGIVHQAPAFGEVDHEVLLEQQSRFKDGTGPHLINAVASDGKFTNEGPDYCRGRWVKDCDKDIIRDLKKRGLLFHQEQYFHDYPFCPRAEEDALIQYPRQSWFIRTSDYKDDMLANNAKINWLPEHIKTGRFGKFLETNVDWALSRERYWGTPLPIWKCQATGKMEAVGSYAELMAKPDVRGGEVWDEAKKRNPDLPDDLRIHKPYIDEIVYNSPFEKGAHMRRVPEVIDCWYDAGSMPFAQWGYRGESPLPNPPRRGEGAGSGRVGVDLQMPARKFHEQFPADFISEAIDQTRGWFYAQLAISTLLFGELRGASREARESETRGSHLAPHPYPHPFRNCIVLGHMLGEDGLKMSKRKRNYLPPDEIFDRYGADALRWYFFANQPQWTSIRYNEQAIKDSIPEFLLRLWNVYSFFVIYANIDNFDPKVEVGTRGWGLGAGRNLDTTLFSAAKSYRPLTQRSELDRWILSELNRTCAGVVERMDAYDNFGACQHITAFVDALSNWYVRRSRDRFWAADKRSVDKLDAYWTLYEALVTTTKLVAPFVPFLAEAMWQNLARGASGEARGAISSDSSLAPRASHLAPESVHLCDYPSGDPAAIDVALSERMSLVRLIASLGRNARNAATLKVRQPLAKVEVILADTTHQAWLEDHAAVIEEELNVKQLEFCDDPALYVEHEVLPNFKLLGPRLGKLLPKVKQWLSQQTGAQLLANIRDNGKIDLTIDGQAIALSREEVEVRIKPKPGWTSANDQGVVVVLSTELTDELIAEGNARDIVRLIQDRRKETGCEYTDRIEVGIETDSKELLSAVELYRELIAQETLAVALQIGALDGVEPVESNVSGAPLRLYVRVVAGQN
jgi:isoleucyl-tRNA synthetase